MTEIVRKNRYNADRKSKEEIKKADKIWEKQGESMKYTVYFDLLFLWNLIMNLCVLWFAERFFKLKSSWWRILTGAIVGSTLSILLQMIPGIFLWAYYLIGIAGIGMCMSVITFPVHNIRDLIHHFGCQLLVAVGLGGLMSLLYHSVRLRSWLQNLLYADRWSKLQMLVLVCISIVILLMLQEGMERYRKEHYLLRYKGLLSFEGTSHKGVGFVDTGNFLIEPISHQPVVIADAEWLLPVLSEEYRTLVHTYLQQGVIDYDWMAKKQLCKAKWIPYQTIGEDCGNLLGIQCNRLVLHYGDECKSYSPVMIGVSRTSVGTKNNYQFIIPEVLVRKIG